MNLKLLILSLGLCFGIVLGLSGCSKRQPEPVEEESFTGDEGREEQEESEPEPIEIDPLTERYFDYVMENNHIGVLLTNEMEGEGFSDDEIAAYVISEFIKLDAYDGDFGIARQAFDAVSERLFGRVLSDYETSKSTILPETGYIVSTGWGGNDIRMVLKEYTENEDDTITAVFYQLSVNMVGQTPDPMELLTGKLEGYGDVRLVQLDFLELETIDGETYWKYLSVRPMDTVEGPFLPYGQQQ